MKKLCGFALLFVGAIGFALAAGQPVPEIDPNSGVAALVLLAGGLLVLRARRKK